jgi:hypothetical protein
MIRKLCVYKSVEIIEAEACKDHIHMLVSIPPKHSVSQIMGYLKGKSSLMIFEKYARIGRPIGLAGTMALRGQCKPPARPVVMTSLALTPNSLLAKTIEIDTSPGYGSA